jgi:hypothetical protein
MGQSLVGGLIGGAGGAIQGFISGGPPAALALGAIGFVGGFASSYMAKQSTANQLADAMGSPEPKFGGYTVNRRGAALHHQIIYGRTRIGGVVVFDDAHDQYGNSSGSNNDYLSRIIVFAGHEVDNFEKVYLGRYELSLTGDNVTSAQEIDENGNPVGSSTTKFNNYLKVRRLVGNHNASLDSNAMGTFTAFSGNSSQGFSDDWTSNHKLLDYAHLALVFKYEDGVWDDGLPEVTARIRGKKVYDPRAGGSPDWSDNPALIVRDFLTDTTHGMGESSDNIDDDMVELAANICDATDWDTNAPKRYTCNGAWTTSQAPVDIVQQLMTSCAGYLWYAQGKWRVKAGKYVAPTITLTEDDLRSPLSVATRHSRRDNFNTVRGTFRGPATNYQFTDYPAVTSPSFVSVDNNVEATLDLSLPFTDTPEEAQRLATIALEKQRSQITVNGSFGMKAFELQVGDNVNITNSRFGWTNKLFEVVAWGLSFEGYELLVNLVLRETTTTTYDEFLNPTGFESDNTNLPGAIGTVETGGGVEETTDVTGLTAESGLLQVKLSWSNPINNSYKHTKIYQHGVDDITPTNVTNTVVGESLVKDYNLNQAGNTKYFWAQAVDTDDNDLGALIGPVSAVVSQAGTNDIADDAVTSAQIANNAVDSDQIVNDAVSERSGSSAATPATLVELSSSSYTTIATTAVSITGNEDVAISYSFVGSENYTAGDRRCNIRLIEDATVIMIAEDVVVSRVQTFGGTILRTANKVSSGNTTYTLQAQSKTGIVYARYAYISAVELKK